MLRLTYITGEYIVRELPGVDKKIRDQLLAAEESGIYTNRVEIEKKPSLLRAFPFSSSLEWGKAQMPTADALYIRMEPFSYPFIRFLQKTKKNKPGIRVILEIPTYPYDEEIKRLNMITRYRDRIYRRYLWKYVDRIVTYSEDDKIFGIRTIRIRNGINVRTVPLAKKRHKDQEIHLIAVAALQPYHGYERLIEGLKDYYSGEAERIVRFLIVGSGPSEEELKHLVKSYGLEDKVLFFGQKTGDPLTEIYDQSDIGTGSFGLYKRGDSRSSALKTREYLSRGLPMISGCTEDVFQGKNADFYLELENDESPVDIQRVVDFYDRLMADGKEALSGRIREFAEKNVDVRSTFRPVIQYITGNDLQ